MTRPTLPGTLPHRLARSSAVLALLAAPAAGQYTSFSERTSLGIDDVEITPDGRYAVARDTGAATRTFVVDLATGQEVYSARATLAVPGSGPANDAVAVTNERALTLGSRVQLLDLTTPLPTLLAEYDCGYRPRDVEIRPAGDLAVIRGGGQTALSGTWVIDVTTGAVLLIHPSEPPGINAELGNDLVAVSDDHAVALAQDDGTGDTSYVVIELDPPGGTGPRVVLETVGPMNLLGRPMDVAISPGGTHAVVRSEDEVALLRLDGTNSQDVRRLTQFPGPTLPFVETAFDTVEITDGVWATITIGDGITADGYVDVQDFSGTHWTGLLDGTPRDLTVTPDGRTLLLHTGRQVVKVDLANLPPGGGALPTPQTGSPFFATHAGVRAGLDSIVATDTVAAVVAPVNGATFLRLYDPTAGPAPVLLIQWTMPGWPIDVGVTPNGEFVVAASWNHYLVVDLRTMETRLDVSAQVAGWFPWCDGVAVHPEHASAFGIGGINQETGWLDTIDLVSRETAVCRSFPNSTGRAGELFALGSTRVGENDLELHARFLPPGAVGIFALANQRQLAPAGGGVLCLAGNLVRLGVRTVGPGGDVAQPIDLTQLPTVGGGFVPGSTWYAQFAHRDTPAAGGYNLTSASSLLFE